jgi:hypothetical protein
LPRISSREIASARAGSVAPLSHALPARTYALILAGGRGTQAGDSRNAIRINNAHILKSGVILAVNPRREYSV